MWSASPWLHGNELSATTTFVEDIMSIPSPPHSFGLPLPDSAWLYASTTFRDEDTLIAPSQYMLTEEFTTRPLVTLLKMIPPNPLPTDTYRMTKNAVALLILMEPKSETIFQPRIM